MDKNSNDRGIIEITPLEFLKLARCGKAEASILLEKKGDMTTWKTATITIKER